MNAKGSCGTATVAFCAAGLLWTAAAGAQPREIDTGKSAMTVRVYKAGFFSAFAHDHEIAAPISRGVVDTTARQVEFQTKAGAMQVRDPKISDKDRDEIQHTMLGPNVLDAEQHPDIVFRSTGAETAAAGSWLVHGNLTIHGQTRAVDVEVRETGGRFVGTSSLKQTDFGIKPVKVAGGTVRVKDEIQIEFDIQLAR